MESLLIQRIATKRLLILHLQKQTEKLLRFYVISLNSVNVAVGLADFLTNLFKLFWVTELTGEKISEISASEMKENLLLN